MCMYTFVNSSYMFILCTYTCVLRTLPVVLIFKLYECFQHAHIEKFKTVHQNRRGVMRARCYPFDMPKHHFHGMNPKVLHIHCTNMYLHVIYIYIHVHNMYIHGTSIYNVHVCMYLIISLIPALLCAGHHPCYPSLALLHWGS